MNDNIRILLSRLQRLFQRRPKCINDRDCLNCPYGRVVLDKGTLRTHYECYINAR